MILKVVVGSGGRGLLDYISQLSKSPTHHPQIEPKIYVNLRLSNTGQHPSRRAQPAAFIGSLPKLPSLNVVHDAQFDRGRRASGGQVLLHPNAPADLERGSTADAVGVRRPGDQPGRAATENGGRRLKDQHAQPTFSTFAGSTPRQIAAEFAALRRQRPGLKKAVGHLILSPGPEDRELTKEEWQTALQIALEEHGAGEAPHAAWLHGDTDHTHLHIFFSRITAAGQVVSDSQSYRKNRSASQKITKELHLTPLPTTPNPDAPGDREAAANAAHRASRRGTPTKIHAQEIREALAAARDREHFERLLAELDVEAEFDRRGPSREIYGWRLRRRGSEEWLKASTVAKDLSWPKIAHRFAETDSSKETPAPLAAALAAPAVRQEDRTPQMLRPILQRQHSANQLRPLSARLDDDEPQLFKSIRSAQPKTNYAALLKTLALLGIETIKLAAKVAAAVWKFIKALLALFGIGLREPMLQKYEQPQPEQITYEPYQLENTALQRLEHDNEDQAAEAVLQVVEALKNNTPEALPLAPGRDELIKTLAEEATKAEGGVADPLTQVFDGTETDFAAPAEPLPDPIISLKQSGAEYLAAVRAVMAARAKPDCGVADSRKKLVAAEREFGAANYAYELFKAKNKTRFHIFTPAEKTRLLEAEALVAQAQKNLDAAQAKQDSAPAPVVPAAVSARFRAAKAALQKDGLAVIDRAQQEAAQIDDVAVKKFALAGAADVKAALTIVLQVASPSELQRAIQGVELTRAGVISRLAEIERLKWIQAQRETRQAAADSSTVSADFQRPE